MKKQTILCLLLTLLAVPAVLAQEGVPAAPQPFSRLAFGGGISLMGVNLQAAVNANRYLNIRGTGNVFSYSVQNIAVDGDNGANGINVNGSLNFASAGISLDYYPFPRHGFRLSPGVMLYNQSGITADGSASSGTSITLDQTTYYSEGGSNALNLKARLGLNARQQAFTMTTGWGNMISRRGGHWSFPFEIGAVFTGVPNVSLDLTGYGCASLSDTGTTGAGASCVNIATNATAQSNLNAQIAKYQNDLSPLRVYPILSFGVAYNFRIHGGGHGK